MLLYVRAFVHNLSFESKSSLNFINTCLWSYYHMFINLIHQLAHNFARFHRSMKWIWRYYCNGWRLNFEGIIGELSNNTDINIGASMRKLASKVILLLSTQKRIKMKIKSQKRKRFWVGLVKIVKHGQRIIKKRKLSRWDRNFFNLSTTCCMH